MSDQVRVRVEDVGKCYRLYGQPADRLKQFFLARFGHRYGDDFWALRHVSFELKAGDRLGIVGVNGSGKSTLLQIIAGTLHATEGSVQSCGRVTALLELGSGFNPDFTGRENVYLNGSILGFSRAEIDRRFDEIAAFADVGQFMNQPVKFYSSGMFVRLAFAVQILCDPDILIVDEALAVGDAAFQIKCISRMKQLSEQGVTIIVVTHDAQTVRSFCTQALWIDAGEVRMVGSPLDVTSTYIQHLFGAQPVGALPGDPATTNSLEQRTRLSPIGSGQGLVRWGSGELTIEAYALGSPSRPDARVFEPGQPIRAEVLARARQDLTTGDLGFGVGIRNNKGLDIITATTWDEGQRFPPLRAGQAVRLSFEVDNILGPGDYALGLSAEDRRDGRIRYFDCIENVTLFKSVSTTHVFSVVKPPFRLRASVEEGDGG